MIIFGLAEEEFQSFREVSPRIGARSVPEYARAHAEIQRPRQRVVTPCEARK
jgi:hypothetical protein